MKLNKYISYLEDTLAFTIADTIINYLFFGLGVAAGILLF